MIYHIADPEGLLSATDIRHRPVHDTVEVVSREWLATTGPIRVGLTSGASTPDNLVEVAIKKLEAFTSSSPAPQRF